MYINNGYEITNTPSNIQAAYNTWPYNVPQNAMYQRVPTYFIDHNGYVREWVSWKNPQQIRLPGGTFSGTPTRTGSYYAQNTT
jgi:hypothetical protein